MFGQQSSDRIRAARIAPSSWSPASRPAPRTFVLLTLLAACADPSPHDNDAGAHDAGLTHDAAPHDDATAMGEDAAGASQDCIDYCRCYLRDCASVQSIPTGQGCYTFCAGFTENQWQCRIDHCRLAVPERNPHHCEHAVGIDQCF